jgi:CAAD domains of cyanobacterial aminoacyl-tRNA synthetase
MTSDTMETYGYNEVTGEMDLSEEPLLPPSASEMEPIEGSLDSFQTNATNFFGDVAQATVTFFKSNRSLMTKLGWVFLAFIGIRVLFAAVGAIESIPLMSPVLKLTGLIYISQFVWRYLLRASDRQSFAQKFNQVKAEFLGN